MKYILSLILIFVTLNAEYFNTNILVEEGIDPKILNLSVTIFKQDVSFEIDVVDNKYIDEKLIKQDFRVLYNPHKKYGIDIGVEIPKKDINNYNKSDIKDELDFVMGLQSYLQSEKLYNQKSIKKVSMEDGYKLIEFEFASDAIPRELKLFASLKGKIYIKNKELKKIVVVNKESFKYKDIDVKSYKKTLIFSKPLDNHGYLINSLSIEIDGLKDGKNYKSNIFGSFTNYKDKEKNTISLRDAYDVRDTRYKEYEKIDVNLDRTLPFFGQEVRKMGYDLPKPFGVSLVTMYQETRFYMDGVYLDGIGDVSRFFKDNSKYENSTYASLVRADMWVLPFLNFSVLVGGTSTSTDINLDLCLVPRLGCPRGGVTIPGHVNTNSFLYGAGATLGGGIGNFFASVDFQYMISYTDTADVETQINIITPIFGYYFQSIGLRAYGGAMYEDLKEDMSFSVSKNGRNISGTIKLKAEKWAGTLGAQYAFTRHWEANVLGAYGKDFQNLSLVVTYRW